MKSDFITSLYRWENWDPNYLAKVSKHINVKTEVPTQACPTATVHFQKLPSSPSKSYPPGEVSPWGLGWGEGRGTMYWLSLLLGLIWASFSSCPMLNKVPVMMALMTWVSVFGGSVLPRPVINTLVVISQLKPGQLDRIASKPVLVSVFRTDVQSQTLVRLPAGGHPGRGDPATWTVSFSCFREARVCSAGLCKSELRHLDRTALSSHPALWSWSFPNCCHGFPSMSTRLAPCIVMEMGWGVGEETHTDNKPRWNKSVKQTGARESPPHLFGSKITWRNLDLQRKRMSLLM